MVGRNEAFPWLGPCPPNTTQASQEKEEKEERSKVRSKAGEEVGGAQKPAKMHK